MNQERIVSKNNISFVGFYTVIFVLVSFLCFSFYFILGKTFFTTTDGKVQHILALCYYGEYLRSIFNVFFTQGKIVIPQWDFNLGLGSDIIQTLHYYVIGDPFSFFSVFFSTENMHILYAVNIFLRLYFTGLSFFAFCKYHNFKSYASLYGAFIYVFCGFSFFCAPRHPYFINPMIWLPLLLIGIDKILEKKKILFFSFFTFVACSSNFYFFYMLTIIVFIYALVRFFFYFPKTEYKNIWKYVILTMLGYIIGICMAAFLLFPNIEGFLLCGRAEEENSLTFLYRANYYIKMILSFTAPSTFGSYSTFGYASTALPLTIYLFTQKDKISRQIKIFLLIEIIFFLFPFFGSSFNGFSYSSNRWGFAFSFAVAAGIAYVLPNAERCSWKNIRMIMISCGAFCLAVFILSFFSHDVKEQFLLQYIILFASILILSLLYIFKFPVKTAYFSLALLSCIFQANFRYSPKGLDYLKDTVSLEEYKELKAEFSTPLSIDDRDFYRVETAYLKSCNAPAVSNFKGTTYYWSMNNGLLYEFYKKNNLNNDTQKSIGFPYNYSLISLLNIKYYLVPEEMVSAVQKYFEYTGKDYLKYKIFENTEFNHFGSTANGEKLKNIKTGVNKLTAQSDFKKEEKIFLSIPYSKHWKAKIDKIPGEIKPAETAFMELNIPAGNHTIELTYNNFYFDLGLIVSLVSFLIFAALIIIESKKNQHKEISKNRDALEY